jgi:LysM repeat protein
MSEFEKRPDQAENLRTKMIDDYKQLHGDYPPRGEVHKDKVKKKKLRMKYPVISLLALFFILLPILFLSITYYYGSGGTQSANSNYSSENELVYISNGQQSDEEQDTGSAEEESDPPVVEEVSIEEDEINMNDNKTSDNELDEISNERVVQKEPNTSSNGTSNHKETDNVKETEYREVKTHTVAAGETLFKIAIKYYNSRSGEEIIRQYNGLEGNDIYEGMVLKIPLN